ncbi:glycosyltransferase family 4 protein [Alsobacter sp. KACC 23698]|uniref:Glycosyltransferase family 4 protein n=1 Tax=Alsobacter sp. KACC 23698 TaxID=3149229 RepID=A0AAU7JIU5_9HYPH
MMEQTSRATDFLILTTHNSLGGTLVVIDDLRRDANELGFSVNVICLYNSENRSSGAGQNVLQTGDGPARRLMAIISLYLELRQQKPRAILTVLPVANVVGCICAALNRIPKRVATHHGPSSSQRFPLRVLDLILGTLGVYSNVVCVSVAAKDSFRRYPSWYRKRISVILNEVRRFSREPHKSRTRAHYGISTDATVFTMVGRLTDQKNILNSIRAIAAVPNVFLVIAGDGPLLQEAVATARQLACSHRVKLLGNVERDKVADILSASDVFFQPSLFEGRSIALLEAVQAGLPIIASNITSQTEVLRLASGAIAGLVCDPHDVNDMSCTLARLAESSALRDEYRKLTHQLRHESSGDLGMVKAYLSLLGVLHR